MTIRKAELRSGKTYEAHVYGLRAEKVTWTPGALLDQLSLWNRVFAVNDAPSRVLEIGEVPNAEKPVVSICPVSGKTAVTLEPDATVQRLRPP